MSEKRLREIQHRGPSGTLIVGLFDLGDEGDLLNLPGTILLPAAAIASDEILPEESETRGDCKTSGLRLMMLLLILEAWVLFPRQRCLFGELGVMSLSDAVRRCSLKPLQILEDAVPATRENLEYRRTTRSKDS